MERKKSTGWIMPDWAKRGAVSVRNYDHRAMQYGLDKQWKDSWPTIAIGGEGFREWFEYFARHLGGMPWAFQALLMREIAQMNMPEMLPQHFDPSFTPTPGYQPRWRTQREADYSQEHKDRMAELFQGLLYEMRQRGVDDWERWKQLGPAPAGTVFSDYDEAVARNGVPRSFSGG